GRPAHSASCAPATRYHSVLSSTPGATAPPSAAPGTATTQHNTARHDTTRHDTTQGCHPAATPLSYGGRRSQLFSISVHSKEKSSATPPSTNPATIGQLRTSGYRVLSVKEEMRKNLIRKLREGEELFPGIVGYEETVIPQVENAILSGQDIVLLGERGQAKT